MGYDHGSLRTYEIIWDRPGSLLDYLSAAPRTGPARFTIHGQFGRHWRLVLTALEDDISTIRDVTEREAIT